jgi:hypothetical protein
MMLVMAEQAMPVLDQKPTVTTFTAGMRAVKVTL